MNRRYLKKLSYHADLVWRNRRLHRMGRCCICGYVGLFYAFDEDHPVECLMCPLCRSIGRHRHLARHLLNILGLSALPTLRSARNALKSHRVLDSSGNGPLSKTVGSLPNWVRGYYGDDEASTPPGFQFTDLQAIQAPDDHYDLLITEDVLEHVPEPQKALNEISRVLKPGGVHLFTVPYDPTSPTRIRAEWRNGAPHHHLTPAYHFDPVTKSPILVFTDFGEGFPDMLAEAGMDFQPLPTAKAHLGDLLGNRPVFLSRKRSHTAPSSV